MAFQNTSFAALLQTELTDDETASLISVYEQAGFQEFLHDNPFQLILKQSVEYGGRQANGFYNFATKQAEVSLTREASSYQQTFEQQAFFSISTLAKTPTEAIQRTLIHEAGHHLHSVLRSTDTALFKITMLAPTMSALSQYGTQTQLEYFAESIAAYIFHRTELMVYDSFGYGIIKKVLERLNLELQEIP